MFDFAQLAAIIREQDFDVAAAKLMMDDGTSEFELYLEHMLPSVVSVTRRISLLEYVAEHVLGGRAATEGATDVIRLGRSVIFVLENTIKTLAPESGANKHNMYSLTHGVLRNRSGA